MKLEDTVPKDWDVSRLGDVARLQAGGTPSRKDATCWGGDIAWVGTASVDFNWIETAEEFITEKGLQSSSARMFPAGAILMAMIGQGVTRGKVATLKVSAAINQNCVGIVPNGELDARFLYHFLASRYSAIRGYGNSGGVSNMNASMIRDIEVPIPPIEEGMRIGQILDRWDQCHSLTASLIAAKRRLKQGLIQQLLTGKRRFSEFGAPAPNGEKPQKWEFPHAGDVFQRRSTKNHGYEAVLSVTQDEGVVRRDELERKIDANSDNFGSYKLVEPGDFVISLRSFQGGLEYSALRGIVSPAYHVIRASRSIVDAFYRHFFKSYEFIGRLAISIIGIRDGKQVNFSDFSFIRIPYPPLEEQEKLASLLNAIDWEIKLLEKQQATIQKQKKALMQQLLTGRLRVKV